MKILLIMTGGTIGSSSKNSVISAIPEGALCLVERYRADGGTADFDTIEPLCILSENMHGSTLEALIRAVADIDCSRYDGIVLFHGTDTLSYSAAMLGLSFPNISLPLVLIAADYPPSDKRSNGQKNFSAALTFIARGLRGVFVAYGNPGENAFIYLSTRLREAEPFTGRFSDFTGTPLFEISGGEAVLLKSPLNPTERELSAERETPFDGKSIALRNRVLMLGEYPDLPFDCFDLSLFSAVLLCLYHSGTACLEGGDTSVLTLAERCRQNGVPLYAASARSGEQYETAAKMLSAGVIPIISTSFEAAYAKLLLANNQSEISPREAVERNVYFERAGE